MKVLVYGANGWIGQQFIQILSKEGIRFIKATGRANNIEGVSDELDDIQPSHIVSFIGRTHEFSLSRNWYYGRSTESL